MGETLPLGTDPLPDGPRYSSGLPVNLPCQSAGVNRVSMFSELGVRNGCGRAADFVCGIVNLHNCEGLVMYRIKSRYLVSYELGVADPSAFRLLVQASVVNGHEKRKERSMRST